MAELKVTNVTKEFGTYKAVDDVTFQVEDGEFVVLLGPSGSGKTTILRMVAGLDQPTSGSIYIDDRLVNAESPRDRDIAMVFQNYALYPHMKIYDNIALPLRARGIPESEIDMRVRETAELLQITKILEKKPGKVSGGEQQRVAVARAVVRNPKVFLFDEPLSNLDAKLRVLARGFLKRLQKELKVTTLYVTHDQAEGMTMADRIAVLNKGQIVQMDTPERVYEAPSDQFVAGFVGSPPMNFIEGKLAPEGQRLYFTAGRLIVPIDGIKADSKQVVLGVRPEDVGVSDTSTTGAVQARIYIAEPLGSVQYVTLDLEGLRLLAQVDPHYDARLNKEVFCTINKKSAYLFEKETGKRIF
ncbi:MAG: ABC transporter ATP-binding protein [Nitrososphaerales archaeon]|nr:ABC transporter ATP-binding protein [Nitrososphaerales archaeon]